MAFFVRTKLKPSFPSLPCFFSPLSSAPNTIQTNHGGFNDSQNIESSSSSNDEALSIVETQLIDKFHSLIKAHHRNNPTILPPNPNLSIPFYHVSNPAAVSPAVVHHVVNHCAAVRHVNRCATVRHVNRCAAVWHGIPFSQAFSFFNWATNLPHFRPSPLPYLAMIDLCGKIRLFNLAWHLLDSMKARFIPNVLSIEHALEEMELVHCTVEMVRIELKTGKVCRRTMSSNDLDFGVINLAYVGRKNRYAYMGVGDPMPKISGVAKLDLERGKEVVRLYGEGVYGGE